MSYQETYERSLSDPDGFWAEAAEDIDWFHRWDAVLDESRPPFYRWFTGGSLNTSYNALDRHVDKGRADQVALIYDSAMTADGAKWSMPATIDDPTILDDITASLEGAGYPR